MKSLEERWEELKEDPVKFRRLFKTAWILAYSMLILGVIVILWFLIDAYLF